MITQEQMHEQASEWVQVHVQWAGAEGSWKLRMTRGELNAGLAAKLLVERDESGRVTQVVPLSGNLLVVVESPSPTD